LEEVVALLNSREEKEIQGVVKDGEVRVGRTEDGHVNAW
jgi:hypothetical protein